MTLSAVSLAYYKYIMDAGLHKFVRFAKNVWNINTDGKTDKEIALEGLSAMENWMKELGLAMNLREIGTTEDMIEDIVNASLIMEGGYKILTKDDVRNILEASM